MQKFSFMGCEKTTYSFGYSDNKLSQHNINSYDPINLKYCKIKLQKNLTLVKYVVVNFSETHHIYY